MINVRTGLAAWALCALVLASGCGEQRESPFNAVDVTGANYGRDFLLTDHTGKVRRLSDFSGKVVTLFFGFTHCPDVCPTNLATMKQAMTLLGADAERVQVLFVTVDPERDTPELLAQYVPAFDIRFLGLYADPATTAATAKEFKVYYQKVAGKEAGQYTLDHSAGTYVFDPTGRMRLYIKHGESAERIAADLRVLLAGK